jgi:hypothetical protein
MSVRSIVRTATAPAAAPGFIGEGHLAVEALAAEELDDVDPFVLLMDDRLELAQRRQIGGAHPHAGLETVSAIASGNREVADRHEGSRP